MANPRLELQRAHTALGRGDVGGAARACQKLLTANPRDIDARYLHGRCLAAAGRWRDAAAEFRRVLTTRGDLFGVMIDLGIAEVFDGNYQAAQELLEKARAYDPRPAQLHFALGLCRLGFGDSSGAAGAFREAIARNPQFPDAYNNLGVACDRLGNLPEAVECFRQAIAIRADFADAHRNLGDALSRLGNFSAAAAAYGQAAILRPADAAAQAELGAAQLAAGEFAAAVLSLERAAALDGTLAGAAANLGEALRNLNRVDEAAAAFRQALRIDPRLGQAHLGLGILAAARNDVESAAPSLMAAARFGRADAAVMLRAAAELEQLGRQDEALSVLRAAADARTGSADIHDALGALLHRLGRLSEALDNYEAALSIDESRVQTHLNCGHVLESLGAQRRAIACFDQALALNPAHADGLASVASCAFRLCDWNLAAGMLSTLRRLPDGIDALHPFVMLAADVDPAEMAQSLQRRARARGAALEAPAIRELAQSRLRIAYVSPDFRAHPVGYAIARLIECHDRTRVAPVAISLSAPDGSAIGTRLRSAFEEFVDASTLSDRGLVKLMRDLAVDVAIDLAGLTTGARPALFAMRAAPVQINYLGFPGSTGMIGMDFIIADKIVLPAADEQFYSEKVLRMPDCYLPFDDTRTAAPAGSGREAEGLPLNGFVFCAFNNGYKISREVFEVWMHLLREVPGSVLWLRSMGPETATTLKSAAAKLNISSDRLVFASFVEDMDAHLARLKFADLFLDTLPYNAHTTAAEALWAGVPVVTCLGRAFAGRVGGSLLSACGLSELVCENLQEYRDLALKIARSPALQSRLREHLHQCKSAAPAFDTQRYTKQFEDLLFDAHRQRGQPVAARE